MKLQIISKLAKYQAVTNPLTNSLLHANSSETTHSSIFSHQDYFPMYIKQQPQKNNKTKAQEFFQMFELNCTVSYGKVQIEKPKIHRKLEPALVSLKEKSLIKSPNRQENLFSFKKQQNTADTKVHSKILTENSESKKKTHYFIASKPKIKLRKFYSLATLKSEQSIKQEVKQTKMGFSYCLKQSYSVARKQLSKKASLTTRQIKQQNKQNKRFTEKQHYNDYEHDYSKRSSQMFEEEKGRLARIRKELNEIYQMKKEPAQIKLKLF